MFKRLGDWVARRAASLVGAWTLVLVAAIAWVVLAPRIPQTEVGSFLPAGAPHNISSDIIKEAFPDVWSNTMIVLIAHRPAGLTMTDLLWLDAATRATRDDSAAIVAKETQRGQTPARYVPYAHAAFRPRTPGQPEWASRPRTGESAHHVHQRRHDCGRAGCYSPHQSESSSRTHGGGDRTRGHRTRLLCRDTSRSPSHDMGYDCGGSPHSDPRLSIPHRRPGSARLHRRQRFCRVRCARCSRSVRVGSLLDGADLYRRPHVGAGCIMRSSGSSLSGVPRRSSDTRR